MEAAREKIAHLEWVWDAKRQKELQVRSLRT